MSQRTVPAPFLMKTYQLVDDPATNDVISWSDGGSTFVVWKTAEFAKDLLPSYFKHNNFSSFVRQLNTYGFRKIVPDKWEFANENFKRGEKELLSSIRRRKTVTSAAASRKPEVADNSALPESSGEEPGSSSTSSPDSKNPGSVDTPGKSQFPDLTDENEKLKRDNQMLSSELAQTKKQCEELVTFLTQYVKVVPEQINRIMSQGISGSSHDDSFNKVDNSADLNSSQNKDDDDYDDDDENGETLKLFGVLLKEKKRKRDHDDNTDFSAASRKEMKPSIDCKNAPWMKISPVPGKSGKVCN
ncbi:heat shock factor protein HSF24 [Ipomoea triloba]|uniref:heat shock factor protein HSF24 n=1 Tax=Ipomoea triloba TaxID=35885 RepID=UPI00125CD6EE|nr:heat shock factor protein HSF24 [Ipomoea triloba]